MLTSLRSDIAETLEAHARQTDGWSLFDLGRHYALKRGAETLRWCDEFDGEPTAEDIADAEELQERLDEIGEIITDKKLTAAQLRREIEAVLSR